MKPFISPNTPRKLVTAFRRAKNKKGEPWKIHVLAGTLGINVGYLHKLIKQGIEPPDNTQKGQAARVAMFLPRKKRQPHGKPKPTPPEHVRWWRRLDKGERAAWILQNYQRRYVTKTQPTAQ